MTQRRAHVQAGFPAPRDGRDTPGRRTAGAPPLTVHGKDRLSTLVHAAAEALMAGRSAGAVGFYWEARAICHARGLLEQEVVMQIAFAGACRHAGAIELATDSYQQAATIAEDMKAWELACQGWLGLGSTLLQRQAPAEAAAAFQAGAAAARQGTLASRGIEALAMAGACFLKLGREENARNALAEAVSVAADAGLAQCAASTLEDVGAALLSLLASLGIRERAEEAKVVIAQCQAGART